MTSSSVSGASQRDDEIAGEMEMSEEQIGELKQAARLPISLETPIGEDGDTEIGHLIPDEDAVEPMEAATRQLLTEQLDDVMEMLDPREQKILRLRYGLDDDTPRTLDQVGAGIRLDAGAHSPDRVAGAAQAPAIRAWPAASRTSWSSSTFHESCWQIGAGWDSRMRTGRLAPVGLTAWVIRARYMSASLGDPPSGPPGL